MNVHKREIKIGVCTQQVPSKGTCGRKFIEANGTVIRSARPITEALTIVAYSATGPVKYTDRCYQHVRRHSDAS